MPKPSGYQEGILLYELGIMVCEAHNGIHPNIIAPGERLFLSLIAGNREDPVFKHRRENPHNVHTYLLYINPRWPESEGPYAPRKHYLLLCASASYESPYADCLDTTVQPRLETVEAVLNPPCARHGLPEGSLSLLACQDRFRWTQNSDPPLARAPPT